MANYLINMKQNSIFLIFFLLMSSFCLAEPGPEIIQLANQPGISLMERGMDMTRKYIGELAGFKAAQEANVLLKGYEYEWAKGFVNPNVNYDAHDNLITMTFDLKSDQREKLKGLCTNMMSYIKGFIGYENPDSLSIGSYFLPNVVYSGRKHTDDELRRAKYIDSISLIIITVQYQDNLHDFVQCRAPVTSKEITIRELHEQQ